MNNMIYSSFFLLTLGIILNNIIALLKMRVSLLKGSERIFAYTQAGDLTHLQENFTDFNVTEKDGSRLIHHAAAFGHVNIISWLLDSGHATVDERDKNGLTPLHYAAAFNKYNVITFLKTKNAVEEIDALGMTPIFYAIALIKTDNIRVVNLLLRDLDSSGTLPNKAGTTLLHCAVALGNLSLIKFLLQRGSLINQRDNLGQSALHYALLAPNFHEIIPYLISKHSIDITIADNKGLTALHKGVLTQKLDLVSFLCKFAPQLLLISDKQGLTPFHYAAKFNLLEITQHLLKINPRIYNALTHKKFTALHLAGMGGHHEMVQFLSKLSKNKLSPLICAAISGNIKMVQELTNKPALLESILQPNSSGLTALEYAAALGHLPVVQWLIKLPHPLISSSLVASPLYYATFNAQLEVVQWILEFTGTPITFLQYADLERCANTAFQRNTDVLIKKCFYYHYERFGLEISKAWGLSEAEIKQFEADKKENIIAFAGRIEALLTVEQRPDTVIAYLAAINSLITMPDKPYDIYLNFSERINIDKYLILVLQLRSFSISVENNVLKNGVTPSKLDIQALQALVPNEPMRNSIGLPQSNKRARDDSTSLPSVTDTSRFRHFAQALPNVVPARPSDAEIEMKHQ